MTPLDPQIPAAPSATPPKRRRPPPYVPALGPRLRLLLWLIFAAVALLGATGIYLAAIRVLEWSYDHLFQTQFSLWMFLVHLLVGVGLLLPFLLFGLTHLLTARKRPNRIAVRLGMLVFLTGLVVGLSGLALIQLEGLPQLPTGTPTRWLVYGLHVAAPVLAVVLYVLHRRAGPRIHWNWGIGWGLAVAAFTAIMLTLHSHDPRPWYAKGSPEGEKYFEPSKARTVDGNFIPAAALMMDEYCLKCHADIYSSHIHSAHKFSSFNNPAYLFSVKETRQRVGVRASRWCAGCHDVVPFFAGAFDDPNYDMVNDPTAKAGITCTACHAMTHINSRSGNGDYTIEEPVHYPFAYSDNAALQWLNQQLVKAKPDFHKKTFLKPFHRDREVFCSTCHKVGVPMEVNHYKEFLRGQNHADSYLLSGVSGHGARSFYYPPKFKRCDDCHMPLTPSSDFGSRDFDGSGQRQIHDHLFVGANTGVAALVKYDGWEKTVERHRKFLQGGIDGKSPTLRIDLFGLKQLSLERQGVDAALLDEQPLRPHLPLLQPGETYLVETVIRTLNMGHPFTQGTADSNEVWVEFMAKDGGRIIGHSGAMTGDDDTGRVDAWSHFINILMLDRHGNRIDRRNPQDIFTPLYDHQIPPGAAQVVHYRVRIPHDVRGPVELFARVRFRKFDYPYMEHVYGQGKVPPLPIVDLCSDRVLLPVAGVAENVPAQTSPVQPAWQRWNDYGIACFLEGGPEGKNGGELGQAERSFRRLLSDEFRDVKAAHSHAYLNLARVHYAYGGLERLEQARQSLIKARECTPPAPWWTVAWFNGLINVQNANLEQAIAQFKTILDPANRDPVRGFDFTKDYVVINELGKTYFLRAEQEDGVDNDARHRLLRLAIEQFEKTLQIDAEDVTAHEYLHKCFERLGAHSEVGQLADRRAFERADDLAHLCREFQTKCGQLSPRELLKLRHSIWRQSQESRDPWLRLKAAPVINEADRQLLEALPELGKLLVADSTATDKRAEMAALIAAILEQLGKQPPPADVLPAFIAASSIPRPALPTDLLLTGLAGKDMLAGPLPPPRLLVLHALREQMRPLFERDEARDTAAQILSGIHLLMHGIYKPDDTAAARAIGIYRQRHPAADRASHAIVIYDAK